MRRASCRGGHAGAPHRRADRSQPDGTALGHRDVDPAIRRRCRGHEGRHSGHAQDHAGPSLPREARGSERRRPQPPVRPPRRRARQGQPPRRVSVDRRRRLPGARSDGPARGGRVRHARSGTGRDRGRRRRDPARQHDGRRALRGGRRRRGPVRGSRRRAASASTPFVPSPRPASTRSPSARSPILPVHSTSPWRSHDSRLVPPVCTRRSVPSLARRTPSSSPTTTSCRRSRTLPTTSATRSGSRARRPRPMRT